MVGKIKWVLQNELRARRMHTEQRVSTRFFRFDAEQRQQCPATAETLLLQRWLMVLLAVAWGVAAPALVAVWAVQHCHGGVRTTEIRKFPAHTHLCTTTHYLRVVIF